MNGFKRRLQNGEPLIGSHVGLTDPSVTELIGNAGYDYVWIDSEHAPLDLQTLQMHIIAARAAGTASLVRVPFNEPFLAKRVLEMGPDGIIFPMVDSAEECKKAMDSCVYPPNGRRGFGPVRAMRYGAQDAFDYINGSIDNLCRFVQVEHMAAVENLESILKTPYLDGIIIGPCDLSGSAGTLNQLYTEQMDSLYSRIVRAAKAANIAVGVSIGSSSEKDIRYWRDKGVQFISSGGDYALLTSAMSEVEGRLRTLFAGKPRC